MVIIEIYFTDCWQILFKKYIIRLSMISITLATVDKVEIDANLYFKKGNMLLFTVDKVGIGKNVLNLNS